MRVSRFFLFVAVLAALSFGYYQIQLRDAAHTPPPRNLRDMQAQPVSVATAEARPMPRQFETVGRAQTIAAVAVRSRIDGVIETVAVSEGQMVKAGDTLFVLDKRLLEAGLSQVEANRAKDMAQLEQARRELERLSPLAQRDFATKSALDQQQAAVSALEASLKADDASIQSMSVQLSYATIKAPIGGRIGSISSKAGASIKANDTTPLLTINQLKPIYVSFSAPQRFLGAIHDGMAKGGLEVVATAPNQPEISERGIVAYTDNAVDAGTNTLGVWATFDNPALRLWPGLSLDVTLVFDTQKDAVVVPAEAVQAGQSSPFIFVIRPDMSAEMRNVTVDRVIGGRAVIASGLKPGESVVTDGQLRLSDGTRVKITPSSKIAADQRPPSKPLGAAE